MDALSFLFLWVPPCIFSLLLLFSGFLIQPLTCFSNPNTWTQAHPALLKHEATFKMELDCSENFDGGGPLSRKDFLFGSMVIGALQFPTVVQASDEVVAAETLKFRLGMKEVGPPSKVIQGEDVFYPEWFAGIWDSYSTTRSVEAPAGIELFGGNRTWEKAQQDVGNELVYLSRFRYLPDGRVIADRSFNIESITSAAMGKNSVLEVPYQDDPNDISFTLSPAGAKGNVFKANMKTIGRVVEPGLDRVTGNPSFSVSEVVRQVVSSTTDLRFDPLVKDIETITIYSLKSDNEIKALQRTSTYIVPVDPVQRIKYEKSRGNAIDVRCYSVVYKLKKSFKP